MIQVYHDKIIYSMEMRKMRQKEKNVSQNINNDSYVANKITEALLDLLKKNNLNKISKPDAN